MRARFLCHPAYLLPHLMAAARVPHVARTGGWFFNPKPWEHPARGWELGFFLN